MYFATMGFSQCWPLSTDPAWLHAAVAGPPGSCLLPYPSQATPTSLLPQEAEGCNFREGAAPQEDSKDNTLGLPGRVVLHSAVWIGQGKSAVGYARCQPHRPQPAPATT